MKYLTIISGLTAGFSGIAGAFFKMFHIGGGDAMLIGSVALTGLCIFSMTMLRRQNQESAPAMEKIES